MYHYKNTAKHTFWVEGLNTVYRIVRGKNSLPEEINHKHLELIYSDEDQTAPICDVPLTDPEPIEQINIEEIEVIDEKPKKRTKKGKTWSQVETN